MRPLFRSPGGKYFARNQLLPLIPKSRAYIEPFCGSAALLFGKGKSELEVLADIDAELIETFKFVQSASDEDLMKLAEKDWTGSAALFQKLRHSRPKSPLERAYRFLYIRRFGSGVEFKSFLGKPSGETKYHYHYLAQVRDRLKDVKLEVADFAETIKKWDANDAFFYLDPPFLMTERRGKWTKNDQERLIACLRNIKGRFLLSQDAKTFNAYKQIYKDAGFYFASFNVRTEIEGNLFTRHYTIANYEIGSVKKSKSVEIEFLGTKGEISLSKRKHRHHSATLFRFDRKALLIDFGETFQGKDIPKEVGAIILTHTHLDHSGGLIGRTLDIPVFISPFFKKSKYFKPQDWKNIKLKEFPLNKRFQILGVRILAVPILHSVDAQNVALFLKFPDGTKISYLTDVLGLRKEHRKYLRNSIYIGDGSSIEKRLVRRHKKTGQPIGHAKVEVQIRWASENLAKAVVFTHWSEEALEMGKRRLTSLFKELSRNYSIPVFIAEDGMKFDCRKVKKMEKLFKVYVKTREGLKAFLSKRPLKVGQRVVKVRRLPFWLFHHSFRGQIVIRFGPSTEHWDLAIDTGGENILQFVLQHSPLKVDYLMCYRKSFPRNAVLRLAKWVGMKWKPAGRIKILDITGKVGLAPGQKRGNPTKNTPAWLELLDKGEVLIAEEGRAFYRLGFFGKKLKGVWLIQQEEPESPFWTMQRLEKGPVTKSVCSEASGPIVKVDKAKRLVYGVVLEPDKFDLQKHTIGAEAIEEALHRYVGQFRQVGVRHKRLLMKSWPVEAYIAPEDLEFEFRGKTERVRKGSALAVVKIGEDDVWQDVLKGVLRGFSIEGKAWFRKLPAPEHFLIGKDGTIIIGEEDSFPEKVRLIRLIFHRIDLVERPAIGRTFLLWKGN